MLHSSAVFWHILYILCNFKHFKSLFL